MERTYKEYMIEFIRKFWYYKPGELEELTEEEVKEIYERLIDWIG